MKKGVTQSSAWIIAVFLSATVFGIGVAMIITWSGHEQRQLESTIGFGDESEILSAEEPAASTPEPAPEKGAAQPEIIEAEGKKKDH